MYVNGHLLYLFALITTYRQHMHKGAHEWTSVTSPYINRYTYRQHMHAKECALTNTYSIDLYLDNTYND